MVITVWAIMWFIFVIIDNAAAAMTNVNAMLKVVLSVVAIVLILYFGGDLGTLSLRR